MSLPGQHPVDVVGGRQAAQIADLKRRVSTMGRDLGDEWIAATLQNGWTNAGGSYAPASYYKDPNGVVRLKGTVHGNVTPATSIVAFTLPTGYRPSAELDFSVLYIPTSTSAATLAVAAVKADGTVNLVIGANYGAMTFSNTMRFVDLALVQFRAEQ